MASLAQDLVPWETDPDTGDQWIEVSQVCGPGWWGALEGVVGAITCESCRTHAVKILSAMHDLVNVQLGKDVYDALNFAEVVHLYQDALAKTGLAEAAHMGLAMSNGVEPVTDPWGSRCRDPDTGHWIQSINCGSEPVSPTGNLTFAIGQNGLTRYEFEFMIVNALDLVVSHDPFTFEANSEYPAELQPRLRERAATRLQVERIASNLDPGSLLTDFRVLDRGAPIVGPDMVVESGNGRVMALIVAQEMFQAQYDAYREELIARAPGYGLSSLDVEGTSIPILVRVRLTSVDRRAFTQEANASATIETSAIEKAKTDAERITIEMLVSLEVPEGQSLEEALRLRANKQFIVAFFKGLPDNEQARLVDASGRLNQDGVRRATMAVFVSAFKGDAGLRLAEQAFETLDRDVRNAIAGISRALGPLAQAEGLTHSGDRVLELSIGDDLASTINVMAAIKRTPGLDVETYLAQLSLIERELTPFQEQILVDLSDRTRSSKRIGVLLSSYAEGVLSSPHPSQGSLFGEVEGPSKEELWNRALTVESQDFASRRAQVEPELVLQGQQDPKFLVDWCNVSADEIHAVWNTPFFRDAILIAVGEGAEVQVCCIGFAGSQYQFDIGVGHLTAGQGSQLRKSIRATLGEHAIEVRSPGRGQIIYQVTLPDTEGSDLTFTPTEPVRERRAPEGVQPTLLQDSFASLAQILDPAPDQEIDVENEYSPGNDVADMGFLGTIINRLGLGFGFAISNFLVSRTQAVAEAHQERQVCYLTPETIELDITGEGDFIRETIGRSETFAEDSFRTVTAEDHRVIVACPKADWNGSAAEGAGCSSSMVGQQILHPRSEEMSLVLDAIGRGIPVLGDTPMEAMAKLIDGLDRQEASDVET